MFKPVKEDFLFATKKSDWFSVRLWQVYEPVYGLGFKVTSVYCSPDSQFL